MLEQEAELEHIQLQQESLNAYHLHSRFVAQGAGSRYLSTSFALSGGWARNEIDLRFAAEGAEARLAGLFTAGNQQLNDIHLNIDHAVPGCISQSDFKGLMHGKGRGVFDGRILVGAQAQHTEAHLNNANLLLSRNAEVDTKPQLETYADNVKCSHGTTVGQLEESQLFYLRSRGIDAAQAKSLWCLGFASEILDRCGITPLRELIENELVAMLAGLDMSQYPQEA
jgi:Fe-S cluster assembly protein SufD